MDEDEMITAFFQYRGIFNGSFIRTVEVESTSCLNYIAGVGHKHNNLA